MLEKDIEKYLVNQVAKLGGKAYKFSSPSNRSVPDRLCCLPSGKIKFVECKATGKKMSPLQAKVVWYLRDLGHEVFVVDSKETINILIDIWKEELNDRLSEKSN
jgi:hypothetical protein